ncbi:MAG: hypothetical protein ACXWAX_10570 [Chthoniobacterales bacterium]
MKDCLDDTSGHAMGLRLDVAIPFEDFVASVIDKTFKKQNL